MHFHLVSVMDMVGFVTENTTVLDNQTLQVTVMSRGMLTSDNPMFYKYAEQIAGQYFNPLTISQDTIYKYLILIHGDFTADIYINDFAVSAQMHLKRDVKAGEIIMHSDVADITTVDFPDLEIKDNDKIIYCFKIGWRFGLFFDLSPREQVEKMPIGNVHKLDIEIAKSSIAALWRYLSFYHVYKMLESDLHFNELIRNGWFPFVEILSQFHTLSEAYKTKFGIESETTTLVNGFSKERIENLVNKWWGKQIFRDKQKLIQAGISAYFQDSDDGYINCIKNLSTEVEGIIRTLYHTETGKGNGIRAKDLINFIIEKGKTKSHHDYSLMLPTPFLQYLENVVFANFDMESGTVPLSRNSSSHGVADADTYTKARALQLILIIDQIFLYLIN